MGRVEILLNRCCWERVKGGTRSGGKKESLLRTMDGGSRWNLFLKGKWNGDGNRGT